MANGNDGIDQPRNGSTTVKWAGFIFGLIIAFTSVIIYVADIRGDVDHMTERWIEHKEVHAKEHMNINALLADIRKNQIKIMIKLGVDPE